MSLIIDPNSPRLAPRLVEVARSFAYKLNVEAHGGNRFESRDFFMSQKVECLESEAEEVSEKVYQFCRRQVLKSVNEYVEENFAKLKRRAS